MKKNHSRKLETKRCNFAVVNLLICLYYTCEMWKMEESVNE